MTDRWDVVAVAVLGVAAAVVLGVLVVAGCWAVRLWRRSVSAEAPACSCSRVLWSRRDIAVVFGMTPGAVRSALPRLGVLPVGYEWRATVSGRQRVAVYDAAEARKALAGKRVPRDVFPQVSA